MSECGCMVNRLITLFSLNFVGMLYSYLTDCTGNRSGGEAFRALQRGYTHCASRSLAKLEINFRHPEFCHVRCEIFASMKQVLYHVYILLGREGEITTIRAAICACAAGCIP